MSWPLQNGFSYGGDLNREALRAAYAPQMQQPKWLFQPHQQQQQPPPQPSTHQQQQQNDLIFELQKELKEVKNSFMNLHMELLNTNQKLDFQQTQFLQMQQQYQNYKQQQLHQQPSPQQQFLTSAPSPAPFVPSNEPKGHFLILILFVVMLILTIVVISKSIENSVKNIQNHNIPLINGLQMANQLQSYQQQQFQQFQIEKMIQDKFDKLLLK